MSWSFFLELQKRNPLMVMKFYEALDTNKELKYILLFL